MTDNTEAVAGKLAVIAIVFACIPISALAWTVLLYESWRMFVPMLPFALPALTFKQAFIFRLLAMTLRGYRKEPERIKKQELWEAMVETMTASLLVPAIALFVNWLLWLIIK